MLHSIPPAKLTTLQSMFLDEHMQSLAKIDKALVYDAFFSFIFEGEINREDISNKLDSLLVDEAVPYPDYFEISYCFYILATRHFSNGDTDTWEIQFFRAMFEAVNALNLFTCKHEASLLEESKIRHKKASSKGGENKWSKIRVEVVQLLKAEIGSGQPLERFRHNSDLTEYLLPKVETYISDYGIKPPDDLFGILDNWSITPKSDIAALYGLLVK